MLKCKIDKERTQIEAEGKCLEIAEDISRLIVGLLEGGVPLTSLTMAVMAGIDAAHLKDKKKEVE